MSTNKKVSQIVWFFGASGAGKETLIKTVCVREPQQLLEMLKIDGFELKPFYRRPGDNLCELLRTFSSECDNFALLIKGQTVDLNDGRPDIVRERMPELLHRIVFVFCNPMEACRRLRDVRGLETGQGGCKAELDIQLNGMKRLRSAGFAVSFIDATNPEYQLVVHPDNLRSQALGS